MQNSVTYDEVLRTAQSLDETERVRLIDELVRSLNPETTQLDEAWLIEIDRRSRELDSGEVQAIPWEEVRLRVRKQANLDN